MIEPTFDSDGYISDESLKVIEEWNHWANPKEFMEFIRKCWSYPDRFVECKRDTYYLSTGGWSGNESVIASMEKNFAFWIVCWQQSKKGGHYWFKVKNPEVTNG